MHYINECPDNDRSVCVCVYTCACVSDMLTDSRKGIFCLLTSEKLIQGQCLHLSVLQSALRAAGNTQLLYCLRSSDKAQVSDGVFLCTCWPLMILLFCMFLLRQRSRLTFRKYCLVFLFHLS